jgi:uncharacterized protein (DUF302 family)
MSPLRYGFETRLESTGYEEGVERVTRALAEEGFGVLSSIDVKETLHNKLGLEFRPYVILGACNPALAHEALEAEADIGLLLPCNVVVQEHPEGGVKVAIADPKAMFTLVDNPRASGVAEEAERRLRRVLEALESAESPGA